jgi:hypothetical protein
MSMRKCIYFITCFYDIGRSSWKNFSRTFDDYLKEFEPFKEIFSREESFRYKLYVFMDEKWVGKFTDFLYDKCSNKNICILPINEEWLKKHTQWGDLEEERKVMESNEFKKLVENRIKFPETHIPEYTMINHIKIDLLNYMYEYIIEGDLIKSYLAWVDFGFFKKDHLLRDKEKYIPQRLLDIDLFDPDKVHYTIIEEINDEDLDVYYTLKNAPEKIAGYFFILRANKIKFYHKLYTRTVKDLRQLNCVDDDQHIVLQCYARCPNLFEFHKIPWHTALVNFQIKEPLVKVFLEKYFEKDLIQNLIEQKAFPKSDDMLTFLGINLNIDQCIEIKDACPNSKIYNIYGEYENAQFSFPEHSDCKIPGIVNIPCFFSFSKIPASKDFENILKKELKYIKFDSIFFC